MGGFQMKNIEVRLSSEQRENFERFMALSDKYKNSWFWGDNGNANCRAYKEKRDNIDLKQLLMVMRIRFISRFLCHAIMSMSIRLLQKMG